MRVSLQRFQRFLACFLLAGVFLGVGACGARTADVSPDRASSPVGEPGRSGACAGNTHFQVGSGIHDITGPAAELGKHLGKSNLVF